MRVRAAGYGFSTSRGEWRAEAVLLSLSHYARRVGIAIRRDARVCVPLSLAEHLTFGADGACSYLCCEKVHPYPVRCTISPTVRVCSCFSCCTCWLGRIRRTNVTQIPLYPGREFSEPPSPGMQATVPFSGRFLSFLGSLPKKGERKSHQGSLANAFLGAHNRRLSTVATLSCVPCPEYPGCDASRTHEDSARSQYYYDDEGSRLRPRVRGCGWHCPASLHTPHSHAACCTQG